MNPALGILLHAIGGFAAGSFYLPLKKVENWAWESYWIVNGVFSWIVAPWVVAALTVPDVLAILADAPPSSLFWTFFYGLLWGIGGLTFGLTMRYLGLSLGYAVAIGFTAAFGTLLPPIYFGEFVALLGRLSGQVTVAGVLVSLVGIAVVGWAGALKDKELSEEEKRTGVQEFDFTKGVWVAVFAGIMSACMAFAIAAGRPIAEAAITRGTPVLWQNSPVLIVVFAGGFLTNFAWCAFLNVKNGTASDYWQSTGVALWANYGFAILAGITWYMQFMFYGMGTSQLGAYEFASWSIHMAFVIVFSNMWGLITKEWRGAGSRTMALIYVGLGVLILSTVVIGWGNYIAQE